MLRCENDSGFGFRRYVFLKPLLQTCLALRLIEIVKNAHLGLVIRAVGDFVGACWSELAVARRAELRTGEPRTDVMPYSLSFYCDSPRAREV